jgi:diguanylate cyclase (GGDEF)-like protein
VNGNTNPVLEPTGYVRRTKGRSLRYVMIGVIIMAMAPLFAFKIWHIKEDNQRQIEAAKANSQFLAKLTANDYGELFSKAQTLLSALAQMPQLRKTSDPECHLFLKNIAKNIPWQNGLWATLPDGKTYCGSINPNLNIDVTEREYYQRVMKTKEFTISHYVKTKLRNHPALVAAYPVLDEKGDVVLLLMATLDLTTLSTLIESSHLKEEAILIMDGQGTILSWKVVSGANYIDQQDMWGKSLSDNELVKSMLIPQEGRLKGLGPDGIERFWAFTQIEGSEIRVAIGVSEHALIEHAREELAKSFILFGLVGLIAIFMAWTILEYFFMRNVRALVLAAEHIGDVGRSSYFQLPVASGELDRVAHAMNHMAVQISSREEALKNSQQELTQKTEVLQATIETMDQGIMMVDDKRIVRMINQRFLKVLDLPEEFATTPFNLDDLITYQLNTGDFGDDQELVDKIRNGGFNGVPDRYERERPNGTAIEVRSSPIVNGGIVRTYTDITSGKKAAGQISHMAHHDVLTGLPNRALFQKRLGEAIARMKRHNEPFALLCLDLDRFKIVNDTLGHPAGDALLKEVSKRLLDTLREEDVVARLGGDEFAILQTHNNSELNAAALAERVIKVVTQPMVIEGNTVDVGTSIGIAMCPKDADDGDTLFRKADLALYEGKNAGRGQFRFYEDQMDAQLQAKRALELDLRDAIANDELLAYYQPIFNIEKGEITGFEALARWNHPKRGFVPPSEFIPLAEESGLIVTIGRWMLRTACRDAASWSLPLKVAINVSAMQFRKAGLVEDVSGALAESGLDVERLELEITESVIMHDKDSSTKLLHQLRDMGARIAMDDFGTGYSSLSYLSLFPFDKIKIDASFIRGINNPDCSAIVLAVVELGRCLNVTITAEGVETAEQLARIKRKGCHEAQGYLISPPLPALEAADLINFNKAIQAA